MEHPTSHPFSLSLNFPYLWAVIRYGTIVANYSANIADYSLANRYNVLAAL